MKTTAHDPKKHGDDLWPDPYGIEVKDETDDATKCETARAFTVLGLFDEAETELLEVSPADPALYAAARHELCQIYVRQGRNEEVVAIGKALIAAGQHSVQVVEDAMVACTFLGRITEAREILSAIESLGTPRAFNAYQRACFDSLEGNFCEALRWLEIEARAPRHLKARSIGDSDLFGLWQWLASPALRLEDAHRLLDLPLRSLCSDALVEPRHEVRLDQNDLKQLPPEFRRLFQYDRNAGICTLNWLAVERYPDDMEAFRKARHAHLAKIAAMIDEGYRRALDLVVAAQPRYAAEQASWGNQLGVRYHLTFGLAHRPEMLEVFHDEPGLAGMKPLIESFAEVQRVDPDFCARMQTVLVLLKTGFDKAWKALEETPITARWHPLFLLRQASLLENDADYRGVLPLYDELCAVWPRDAVGFANAANALMHLERWEDADAVLEQAPECYRRFRLSVEQAREIARREMSESATGAVRDFRGQRDLGGLLCADDEALNPDRIEVSP